MPPVFSVIVPTYNSATHLPNTIECVLRQTFADLELIIVDDGSTDNTAQLVASYDDGRLRYHYQPNSGLPASPRNTGIRLACGRYVAFLDADDVWYPTKLERTYEAATAHPQAAVICHDEHVVRDGQILGTNHYGPYEPDMFRRLLFRGNALSTSATTVKRDALEAVGGFDERPEFYCVEDHDLWLRLARAGFQFHFLAEVLGEYRLHDQNASANLVRHQPSLRAVLNENYRHVIEPGWPERRRHWRNVARTYHQCARGLCQQGEFDQALMENLRALTLYPLELPAHLRSLSATFLQWGQHNRQKRNHIGAYASYLAATLINPPLVRLFLAAALRKIRS